MLQLMDILAAKSRIANHIHKTPILSSRRLNQHLGCSLSFKCEALQKTGSFKARGALNALLSQPELPYAITTYSSGNHGQALAWLAQSRDIKAFVFVPEHAPDAKLDAMRAYGAQITFAGTTVDARKQACLNFAEESRALVIPPFDDPAIMAGQGTTMIEILEDLPHLDAMLVPTGGGGLLSGVATVLRTLRPHAQVFACEPVSGNDAQLSLQAGEPVTIPGPKTMADGVLHVRLGDLTWPVISQLVTGGLTCSEDSIVEAMRLCHRYLKLVAEPTGVLGLACLLEHRDQFAGKQLATVVTGGNISPQTYGKLISAT
ncbi:MAG: threonine/serine dehydratase [Acidobacteria bacterium]|nr:threonine/serine dehydratase [Acidobacteriota bacterium]